MKLCIILITLFSYCTLRAQQRAGNWYFGHHCGLTFNTLPPVAASPSQIYTNEGCSSISDDNGVLLFYSDGVTIWNSNHVVMPNGNGLNGQSSSSQSCLIAPDPGNEDRYYIFTAPEYSTNHGLEYSVVDMTLENGMGDVTSSKNIVLLTNSTEKLTAVSHSNGTEYWVIGHSFQSNDFYAWLVTTNGINAPVISSCGMQHASDTMIQFSEQNKIGCMKASPCGDKLACAVLFDSFLELFDFNNSTGIVSNPLLLGTWPGIFPYGIYGVEFSTGCSKLYASNESPPFVVQYDLLAGSPAAVVSSEDTVCTSGFDYYGALQNGPDGKIYLSRLGNNYVGCIKEPDLAGVLCDYDSYYADAGGSAVFGLPNFIASWFKDIPTAENDFELNNRSVFYPNPIVDFLNLDKKSLSELEKIKIKNAEGKTVFESEHLNEKTDLSFLPDGIYFITAISGKKIYREKILKSAEK